jgi:serine/threonine protein kinase
MAIAAGTQTETLTFLRELGHGGMGTVYLAEDRQLGKRCAVKVLHSHLAQDGTARARFQNEVRAAAAIDHPAIVKTYAVEELPDGRPCCRMEYVEGPTLTEFCKRRREPLPLGLILQIIAPICEAFDHLHLLHIVHRDLKPDNVLLVERGGQLYPRVLDFGIARRIDEPRLTGPGIAPGTAAYMAPEQAQGGAVDRSCDVYSLGVMTYWMATGGRLPHEVSDGMMYFAQVNEPPVDPRRRFSGISERAASVMLTAIHPDPVRRPGSMGALALMLARCVVGDGLQPDGAAILRTSAPSLLVIGNLDETLRSPSVLGSRGPQAVMWKYDYGPVLGRGGMAEVVRATLRGEGQFAAPRALKLILPELATAPEFEEWFHEEARIAAMLEHRNIVRVLEHDRDPTGRLYLAMEFVEGVDLDKLRRTGPMPLAVTIHVLCEVLEALEFAHHLPPASPLASPEEIVARGGARGIVHRDVSHHNVLVSWLADVKLSDFGIAKLRTATAAAGSRLIKGKPGYMSPEQASARDKLDGRADLWAIGVMLWELLTGRLLFEFDDFAATMYAVLWDDIPRPSTVCQGVPSDLEAIAMRLLERDLTRRFQTARQVITALQACRSASHEGRAELARLLAERFPERALRVPVPPDPAAAAGDHRPPDEPSPPGQRTLAVSTSESPAAPWQAPTTTGHTHGQAIRAPAHRARRWPWITVGVLSLAAATTLALARRPDRAVDATDATHPTSSPRIESVPAPATSSSSPSASIPPTPAPSLVTATIATRPPGARAWIEASSMPAIAALSPITVRVMPGTRVHVRAELEGFQAALQDATIDHEGQTVEVTLAPLDGQLSHARTIRHSTSVPGSATVAKPRTPVRPPSAPDDDPGIIE